MQSKLKPKRKRKKQSNLPWMRSTRLARKSTISAKNSRKHRWLLAISTNVSTMKPLKIKLPKPCVFIVFQTIRWKFRVARGRKPGLACRMEKALETDRNRQIYHRADLGNCRKRGQNRHQNRAFDGFRHGNARNDETLFESDWRKLRAGNEFSRCRHGNGNFGDCCC